MFQNVHYYQESHQNGNQKSCQMKGDDQLTQPHCETEDAAGQRHWFHHQYPVREGLGLCCLSTCVNPDTRGSQQPNLYLHSDTRVKLRCSHELDGVSVLSYCYPSLMCSVLFGLGPKSRSNITIKTVNVLYLQRYAIKFKADIV